MQGVVMVSGQLPTVVSYTKHSRDAYNFTGNCTGFCRVLEDYIIQLIPFQMTEALQIPPLKTHT
jgi:hypothetical protein